MYSSGVAIRLTDDHSCDDWIEERLVYERGGFIDTLPGKTRFSHQTWSVVNTTL